VLGKTCNILATSWWELMDCLNIAIRETFFVPGNMMTLCKFFKKKLFGAPSHTCPFFFCHNKNHSSRIMKTAIDEKTDLSNFILFYF
jgi:hypothetical protein